MKTYIEMSNSALDKINEHKMLRQKVKKKLPVKLFSVIAFGLIVTFPVKALLSKEDFMPQWGKFLNSQKTDDNAINKNDVVYKLSTKGILSENTVSASEVFAAGNDVLITKRELAISKEFYILQGKSKSAAEKEAVKYVKEFNALYVEAINNGFDVTESEVDNYLIELREMLEQSANSEYYKKVISEFDSEDAYWEFEKTVYKKQLPIQKYVSALEKEYTKKTAENFNGTETTDLWNDELDKIKDTASKKQNYKLVNSDNDISKIFIASK